MWMVKACGWILFKKNLKQMKRDSIAIKDNIQPTTSGHDMGCVPSTLPTQFSTDIDLTV